MKIGLITRVLLAATLVLAGVPLRAEVIPGRWEKLEQQRRHLPLIITLRSGDRLEATYHGATGEAVLLRTLQGAEMRVSKADVVRVETVVGDSVRNGVLWGAATGFVVPFLTVVLGCWVSEECKGENDAVLGAAWGLAGAGVGAATGLMIDGAQKKREVLYQAPQAATSGNP